MKKNVNKLLIIKDLKSTDTTKMFSYVFNWMDGEEVIISEIKKIHKDSFGNPVEDYILDDLVNHKINCCLNINIENFIIETLIL